jgi:membrane fusion protein
MHRQLFRQQALDAQADRLYGATLQSRLPSLALLTLLAVAMTACALAFLIFGEYTRKERVSGFLAPTKGLIKVFTPQGGTVVERRVSEGATVTRGQVLLIVSSERATADHQQAQAAMLEELKARRDSLRLEMGKQAGIDRLAADALSERIRGLSAELVQVRAQSVLQRERVASAQRTVRRHQELVAANFVSEATLQEKQDALLEQRSQLTALERTIAALTRDVNAARLDLASSALRKDNNAAAIDRQISELEQQLTEVESRREIAVTAPAEGTVTTIMAEPGQAANPAIPLLSILPKGAELEAHLLVPTRAAGFVRAQQRVALRYAAFPYQRFGHHLGQVREVGRTIIQSGEANLPLQPAEPVYRVTVRLPAQRVLAYGEPMSLQAGMTLDADVWIDRRRLIEWVFDPIFAVARRI